MIIFANASLGCVCNYLANWLFAFVFSWKVYANNGTDTDTITEGV